MLYLQVLDEFMYQSLSCQLKTIQVSELDELKKDSAWCCLRVTFRCIAANDYLQWK
jgi:hypothetical protein